MTRTFDRILLSIVVSRVESADMFALYFSGKPSSIYDKDNPDWAPSQKLGYDNNKEFFRLSHEVVTCDGDRDVSTAHC